LESRRQAVWIATPKVRTFLRVDIIAATQRHDSQLSFVAPERIIGSIVLPLQDKI
jgi:hypothetical protein